MNEKGKRLIVFRITLFALLLLSLPLAQHASASSDDPNSDLVANGKPIGPAPADPAIVQAIDQVSPERVEQIIAKLVSFNNRSTLSSTEKDLPPGQGVTAAADWIASQLELYSKECGGCLEVKRDSFTEQPQSRIAQPTPIINIYAILRGSDPAQAKRMYLVTGHYDSRNSANENARDPAPGANDDASGVAVSLECARVLSRLKLPATLVFAAVAGEEQGLNGSRHLAKLAQSEGWHLEGVLNNDIVGGDTTPGDTLQNKRLVRVFSESIPASATPDQAKLIQLIGAENDSPSRELARAIDDVDRSYFKPTARAVPADHEAGAGQEAGAGLQPVFQPVLIFRRDRFLRGGDHTSFNQEGFAAVRFTEWRENFDHQHQNVRQEGGRQYGDLLTYVDFSYVANVARLNAATLATLASAPGPPKNVRVVTRELDNNTTLHWEAPEGAPAGGGYEVVWRKTSAPDWQYYEPAPSNTEAAQAGAGAEHTATLPISKDNVLFGVRSLDKAGHRSAAVIPFPER